MKKPKRISLRALGADDLERTLVWVNDAEVTRYTGTLFPISSHEHKLWYEEPPQRPIQKDVCDCDVGGEAHREHGACGY